MNKGVYLLVELILLFAVTSAAIAVQADYSKVLDRAESAYRASNQEFTINEGEVLYGYDIVLIAKYKGLKLYDNSGNPINVNNIERGVRYIVVDNDNNYSVTIRKEA